MTKLEDLKEQILALSPEDFRALVAWVGDVHHDRWDEQMEQDAAAGRLGKFHEMADQAEEDFRAGRYRQL